MRPAPPNDVGIRLIVLYKCCKAVVQVALAATLVILAAKGEIEAVRHLATTLIEEGASRWLVLLGKALDVLVSERGVRLLEIGLALDAVISSFEGWALWRGYRWAAWLVVAATALPLPFEVLLVLRSPRAWRIATILVNLAIVAYLARRVARRHPRPLRA